MQTSTSGGRKKEVFHALVEDVDHILIINNVFNRTTTAEQCYAIIDASLKTLAATAAFI
jgi:hypothetical protein